MTAKNNCWDNLNCPTKEACPAYPDFGRKCFAVTGTLCRGESQGSYEDKISSCRDTCKFYLDMMFGGAENKPLWTGARSDH
jgi:methyl-accepting chemotaxis protein